MIPLMHGHFEAKNAKLADFSGVAHCYRIDRKVLLMGSEWRWVVNQIYNAGDSRRVEKLIEAELQCYPQSLTYENFLQLVLAYHLARHQKFIQPLVLNSVASIRVDLRHGNLYRSNSFA